MSNSANFNHLDNGSESQVKQQVFTLPGMGSFKGKLFLKQALQLTGMEASINVLPAGAEMPFKHRHHENEELYFFIRGEGEFEVDNERFKVQAGSAVRVSPQGVRTWRNTGRDDLYYIVIQARANSLANATVEDGELVE